MTQVIDVSLVSIPNCSILSKQIVLCEKEMMIEKFNKKNDLLTYEETELGILIALEKSELLKINEFRKNSNGPVKTVSGFPFVHCDEQESLKIDFEQKSEYLIANLKKFV